LDGETLVKVIKPPIVHIDISGIMLDLDHVKGLLQVCHSTLLTVHKLGFFSKLNMVLDEKMNQTVFLVKYIINEIHIQLYPTASSKSPTTVLPIKIITRWKGLLQVCHSTLLTVHCGINNSVSKEQFEDVNRQYRDFCYYRILDFQIL
jgi:hypothetical protein